MEEKFKEYLNLGNTVSKVTVKNYLADVAQFTRWYKKVTQKKFDPSSVTVEVIDRYFLQKTLSKLSLQRHNSSLRKFFTFLTEEKLIAVNPYLNKNKKVQDD